MKKFLNSLKSRSLRVGGYSVVATVIVVAVLVAVNVIVAILPSTYTEFDLTASQIYKLSDQSIELAKKLQSDVTFYWVVTDGNESYTVETLLNRYASYSDHIRVVKIDIEKDPAFATQYEITSAADNSILVVGYGKDRWITPSDLFSTYYVSNPNLESGMEAKVKFTGENAVTSALNYLVMEDYPLACFTVGHGETSLNSTYAESLGLMNVETQTLNVGAAGEIPEDCDVLVMLMPTTDISEEEAEIILEYTKTRGNLILVSIYVDPEMESQPNLKKLMGNYGVSQGTGFIVESDADHYYSSKGRMYLMPIMRGHAINISLTSKNYRVLMPMACPILIAEELPSMVSGVRAMLYTSDDAYSKVAGFAMSGMEKENGDLDGPFNVGTLSIIRRDDGKEGYVSWYSSPYLVDANVSKTVSGANETLFLSTISYLTDMEDTVAINGKVMDSDYLIVPAGTALTMTVIFAVVIPLLLIAVGVVVTIRRKRR